MPELGQLLAVLALGVPAAAWVAWPLLGGTSQPPIGPDVDELALAHRAAIETLAEVEADHRAGLLDGEAYRREHDAAEERATTTLRDLDAHGESATPPSPRRSGPAARRMAIVGGGLAMLLVAGLLLPEPLSLASATSIDRDLAASQAAEAARQDRVADATERLRADPTDTAALSDLADAHLAGGGREDLVNAATALLLLINLEPDNEDAYRRIITAYIGAGDYANASAALESYAALDPDPADLAFLNGIVALRTGDGSAAVTAFDRFLELAPDDPRTEMVRQLRAEAAGDP